MFLNNALVRMHQHSAQNYARMGLSTDDEFLRRTCQIRSAYHSKRARTLMEIENEGHEDYEGQEKTTEA